jgi:hypothetical protein
MAIKKCVAVRLGVIYDAQATNRKQGGLPVSPPPPCRTSIGRKGVIYDSQPAGMHKKTPPNKVETLTFD